MTKVENAGVYTDPQSLNKIKSNPNKKAALTQAAGQFEAMFLQMVLKNMRAASDALADEESIVSSRQQRMYRDMYDGQLAMAMSGKGTLGLAESMVKQLENTLGEEISLPTASVKPKPASLGSSISAETQQVTTPQVKAVQAKEVLKPAEKQVVNTQVTPTDSFRQSLINLAFREEDY